MTAAKFAPNGSALPYPGNTIVCPVEHGSVEAKALGTVSAGLRSGPWANKFAFLPPDSFHMTLYRGVNNARRLVDEWPDNIGLDEPLDQVTGEFARRLRGLDLGTGFRMVPVSLVQCASGESQLNLAGGNAEEEKRLAQIRSAIGAALHHRRPGEAEYQLHITFSYQVGDLTPQERDGLKKSHDALFTQLRAACPIIRVGPPALCRYEDMLAFYPVKEER